MRLHGRVGLAALLVTAALACPAADAHAYTLGTDGETAETTQLSDAIRQRVLIPQTGIDQDGDAVLDNIAIEIIRPAGTNSANKLLYTGSIAPVATTPAPAPTTPTTTTPAKPTTCTFTNNYDKSIPDLATIESNLTVSGCTGKASATAKLEVHIKHTDRGDLRVDLVAPDGTAYKVKSSTSGDDVANLDTTYTVNVSSEDRNGTWKLRVQDVFAHDTGMLDSWTLTL